MDNPVSLYRGYFLALAALISIVVLARIVVPNIIFSAALRKITKRVEGKVNTKAYLFLPSFLGKYKGKKVKAYFYEPGYSFFIPIYFSGFYNYSLEYEIATPFVYHSNKPSYDSPIVAEFIKEAQVKEKIDYLRSSFDVLEFLGDKARLEKRNFTAFSLGYRQFDNTDDYLEAIDFLVDIGYKLKRG